MESPFKSGFVAIVGRPNAGKSTLVNRLVAQKVSIVTSHPQTTRNRIQGIVNRPGAQVVLIDTPGLHRPDSVLGRQMVHEIEAALDSVDVVALVLDASEDLRRGAQLALEKVAALDAVRILLLNKVDRVEKTKLLPLMEQCNRAADFAAIVPVCALRGEGVEDALAAMIAHLPEGPAFFPLDQVTDQPERFLAAEFIRERAMAATRNEVPHSLAVLVESFDEGEKIIRIRAKIQVERDGQKGILIGKGGLTLKKIGTEARQELEHVLSTKIYLELQVAVARGWRDNAERVRQLDWRTQMEEIAEKQVDEK
jgi:GTP-binding protein Era